MPISSGAAGRVDVGIDTSIVWTPDGVKMVKPVISCDSYLRRYLESHARKKKHNDNISVDASQHFSNPDGDNINPPSPGVIIETTAHQENGTNDSEESTSGNPTNQKSLKKSKTCTLL
ncbi:hypothetical protein UPYG_G00181340 [Umbra pygmaea]|uniref:Uncharacterized protein n=1 Tax=Umbra pygmaea TaxID=75934 RepID=A0ABD0WQY7_UMBPY